MGYFEHKEIGIGKNIQWARYWKALRCKCHFEFDNKPREFHGESLVRLYKHSFR